MTWISLDNLTWEIVLNAHHNNRSIVASSMHQRAHPRNTKNNSKKIDFFSNFNLDLVAQGGLGAI